MREYSPLFCMSDKMINLLMEISEEVGRVGLLFEGRINNDLRKESIIKKVYASLAMENSNISYGHVREIIVDEIMSLDDKDAMVVKNMFEAYDMSLKLSPYSVNDLLLAYKMIFSGFGIETSGYRQDSLTDFRSGLFESNIFPSRFLAGAIRDVFEWCKVSELHPLIKSIIAYFEFEFLEPFADGNGLIARLWFDLLLCKWKDVFFCLPLEEELYKKIQGYKEILLNIGREGGCNRFVEFILDTILCMLKDVKLPEVKNEKKQVKNYDVKPQRNVEIPSNINSFAKRLVDVLGNEVLSTNEIMLRLGMTHKPTFRKNYLNPAIEMGLVEMTVPGKPRSRYQRYKKIS